MAGSTPRPGGRHRGPDAGLDLLGLRPGEAVRWQARDGGRWHAGTVTRREVDGSIGVVDARGGARSLPVERLQVRRSGPRGGAGWEPLAVRAGRSEQLCLLELG
ncbi:MAG TPA: hypothetical protein VFP61_15060 [Acidimicrobiales bacterium]|nr:hypothetical protein [Acidimicrobiales bacterium]